MAHALRRKTAQVLLCVFRLLLISTITAAQPSVTYAKPFTLQVSNAPDDDRSGAPVQTAFLFPPPSEDSDQPILGPFGSLGTTFGLNHDGILVDLAIHFFTYPYGDNLIISFNTLAVVDANRDSACICSNGALVFSCTCDDTLRGFLQNHSRQRPRRIHIDGRPSWTTIQIAGGFFERLSIISHQLCRSELDSSHRIREAECQSSRRIWQVRGTCAHQATWMRLMSWTVRSRG